MVGRATVLVVLSWCFVACSRKTGGGPTTESKPVAPRSIDFSAPSSTRREPPPWVRAALHGVVVRDREGVDAGQEVAAGLEVCPGERVAPCPGVRIVGSVDDQWISAPGGAVPVTVHGRYDGARIEVERVERRAPRRTGAAERMANPCAEYQTRTSGSRNPSATLLAAGERIQDEYADRVAGVWWDEPRKTLTIRLTGDAADVGRNLAPKDRLCVVGGAPRSRAESHRVVEELRTRLEQRNVGFLSGGVDEASGRITVVLEMSDATARSIVHEWAGNDARIHAFVDLQDAEVDEVRVPPSRSAFPLVTGKYRTSGGMLHGLGRFSFHLDRANECIYLRPAGADMRIMPMLPFGYRVVDEPLRLLDFDGVVVAREGEVTNWGGGHVRAAAADPQRACSAENAWSGAPIGHAPGPG